MGDSILAYAEKRVALPGKERLQLWTDTLLGEIVDKGASISGRTARTGGSHTGGQGRTMAAICFVSSAASFCQAFFHVCPAASAGDGSATSCPSSTPLLRTLLIKRGPALSRDVHDDQPATRSCARTAAAEAVHHAACAAQPHSPTKCMGSPASCMPARVQGRCTAASSLFPCHVSHCTVCTPGGPCTPP